jgi:hypothetical protein
VSEIVFLAGTDPAGTDPAGTDPAATGPPGTDPAPSGDSFYANAKQFFTDQDASVPVIEPASGSTALSLESLLAELATRAAASPPEPIDVIDIVSRATGMGAMDLTLFAADEAAGYPTRRNRLFNALLDARAGKDGALQPPTAGVIAPTTRVVLYGCGVGRDTELLGALGELFGFPASVSAPIRTGVFQMQDGAVQHRLVRTWTVLWGATSIAGTADANWSTVRSTFTQKAGERFTTGATSSGDISAAAADATLDATKDSFFFPDRFWVLKSAISGILPLSSPVITSDDDDDTTVPITITADDMSDGNADLSDPNSAVMNLAVLASVIDRPVSLDDTTQYRTQAFGAQAVPAGGPEPSPTDDGSPPPAPTSPVATPDTLAVLGQQYVAAGGTQDEWDAYIADMKLPPADPYAVQSTADDPPDPDGDYLPVADPIDGGAQA